MDKKTARKIKALSLMTEKSEKGLKREYYKLNSKERFQFKKEMEKLIINDDKDKV